MKTKTRNRALILQEQVLLAQEKYPFEYYIGALNEMIAYSLSEKNYVIAQRCIDTALKYLCFERYAPSLVEEDDISSADSLVALLDRIDELENGQ